MIRKALRKGTHPPPAVREPRPGDGDPARLPRSIPPSVATGLRRLGGAEAFVRSIPSRTPLARTARVFSALSDPARLRILVAIRRTPLCPCLLHEVEPMKDAALSYHLKVLKEAGLVERAAVRNYRVYRVTRLGAHFVATVDRGLVGEGHGKLPAGQTPS